MSSTGIKTFMWIVFIVGNLSFWVLFFLGLYVLIN